MAGPPGGFVVPVDGQTPVGPTVGHENRRSDIVKVKNTCSKGYKIKVIWAHETDSQREYLPGPGGTMTSERNWPGRYDGLKFC